MTDEEILAIVDESIERHLTELLSNAETLRFALHGGERYAAFPSTHVEVPYPQDGGLQQADNLDGSKVSYPEDPDYIQVGANPDDFSRWSLEVDEFNRGEVPGLILRFTVTANGTTYQRQDVYHGDGLLDLLNEPWFPLVEDSPTPRS